MKTLDTRRYDIDWLRVILFGILILYHVGIGFTDWSVYGIKNNVTGGKTLDLLLDFSHTWRLPALFMISGMGTYFALRKRNIRTFIQERVLRLMLPLFVGVNLVNIIHVRVLNLSSDTRPIIDYIIAWWTGEHRAEHLWFIENLFIYSLIAIPLYLWIKKFQPKLFKVVLSLPLGSGLILFSMPLLLIEILLKPSMIGYVGKGYEFFWYLTYYMMGYILMSYEKTYDAALKKFWIPSLILAGICFIQYQAYTNTWNAENVRFFSMINLGGWQDLTGDFHTKTSLLATLFHGLTSWFMVIGIMGLGRQFFSKPSKVLSYLSQGVYPFYIFHMSITLIALNALKSLQMNWQLKFVLISLITAFLSWLLFELVKRNEMSQLAFGIKVSK